MRQQPVTAKERIIQFLKEGECPVRKQKNPKMKLLNRASDWKVLADLKTSLLISSSHYSNREAARHCSVVRFKEKYPPHRTDCPLNRRKTDMRHCVLTAWKRVGYAM